MFNQDNIIEFINKLINQIGNEENEEVKNNLRKFRVYLELTQMCDNETLVKIDKVLDCYDSLMNIKCSFGFVDVSSLFMQEKKEAVNKLVKKRTPKPVQRLEEETEKKHYSHYSSSYSESVVSSGCGGSVSYSSGCGCGSSYRSGC